MKNIFLRLFAVIVFPAILAVSSCKSGEEEQAIPVLKARTAAPGNESSIIRKSYDAASAALKSNPGDLQQYINLASVFIAEGRATGNNSYYDDAALKMIHEVEKSNTPNKDIVLQAHTLKATVLLNLHQFQMAYDEAKKGLALNPHYSGIYGSLIDASVELGKYDEAVTYCDKMLSIRPDLRSYSRASYLRQIHGQWRGAIEAMKMAVEAGVPGDEATEWARTTLGDLYLTYGNPDSASITFRSSLVYRPGYPYALAGMGRVEKVRRNYDAAIRYTEDAIKGMSQGAFVEQLATLYELKGNKTKAEEINGRLLSLMQEGQEVTKDGSRVPHNAKRELATAYLNAGNDSKALEFAKADLAMRPANIDANELAAWICYLRGNYAQARVYADKMLLTKCNNPALLYKAGLIYVKAGEIAKGDSLASHARVINPYVDALGSLPQPVIAAISK